MKECVTMNRKIFLLLLFFTVADCCADYILPGINLGLRATQMLLNESKARKKEEREAELHRRKTEKEQMEQSGLKPLASILQFRYRIKLQDVENHPDFWKYAEKVQFPKNEKADTTIMKSIEKKDFNTAAAAINAVVNRLKQDKKWPLLRQQK